MPSELCPVCDAPVPPKRGKGGGSPKVYCSTRCTAVAGERRRRGASIRDADNPRALSACQMCGDQVVPTSHGGPTKKYCSAKCRSKADAKRNGLRRSRLRGGRAKYRRERYRNDPEWRRRVNARNSYRYNLKRAAAVSGKRFGLDDIFERDNQKCHLCGKKVKRSDASIDHLIPISLGGEHSLCNVALAHRSCNSRKNNRPANEQLRLVG
jgi:5-methylcytosine-specific restriction endonuclease McrA